MLYCTQLQSSIELYYDDFMKQQPSNSFTAFLAFVAQEHSRCEHCNPFELRRLKQCVTRFWHTVVRGEHNLARALIRRGDVRVVHRDFKQRGHLPKSQQVLRFATKLVEHIETNHARALQVPFYRLRPILLQVAKHAYFWVPMHMR